MKRKRKERITFDLNERVTEMVIEATEEFKKAGIQADCYLREYLHAVIKNNLSALVLDNIGSVTYSFKVGEVPVWIEEVRRELWAAMANRIERLYPAWTIREVMIFKMRNGLSIGGPMTTNAVAEKIGMSGQGVRVILAKMYPKVRRAKYAKVLIDG